jgi:hypothetical protein
LAQFKREQQTAAANASKVGASSADVLERRGREAAAGAVKDVIAPPGSALAAADAAHAALMDKYIKPLNEGAMGSIFTPELRAAEGGREAIWSKSAELFDAGNGKYTTADIAQVASNLRKTDPEAFPKLFQNHMETVMARTGKDVGGRPPVDGFGNAVAEIAGRAGEKQREVFNETMRQIALSKGANPAEIITGAEKYMDALRVLARDQGGLSKVGGMGEAGAGPITHLGKTASVTAPARWLAWAVERHTQKRLFREMTDALTSDNGIEMLRKIANKDMTEARVMAVVRGSMGLDVQIQSPDSDVNLPKTGNIWSLKPSN